MKYRMVVPSRHGPVVKLDDNSIALVSMLAHARNDRKESRGVVSKKIVADRGELLTHELGIGAEVAVASFYGVFPCCAVGLRGDSGADVVVDNTACEVKCRLSRGQDFALMGTDPSEFRSSVGVLVYRVGDWEYEIHGIISRRKFLSVCEERDYGHGSRLVATCDHFSEPAMLRGAA
jgi:hypothetical protein